MAADSDDSSASASHSHSHSHSQSDASSNEDSLPMKNAISPTPSPRTPSSHERKFNNLFAKAGLESDNESSHPSRASTSVSSESHSRSPIQRRNSARSSRSSSAGSHTFSRSALSPTSSSDPSSQDHSSGSPSHSASRSVPASHGSSRDGSKSRSRRSTGTNSDYSAPSQVSSHPSSGHSSRSRSWQSPQESPSSTSPASTGNDSESNQNHDSETASVSGEERSNQGSRFSRSDVGSPAVKTSHEISPGRTATNEEPGFNSTSNDDGDSRSISSRSNSRGDVSEEQQANHRDPGNKSDRTSVETQSPRPKKNETRSQTEHSDTSPKINPENGLNLPTQSNPSKSDSESESETKTPGKVAPVEAMHSDPNEAPILKPPLVTTKDEHARQIEETITDDGKSPAATSGPEKPGDTTSLPQSTRSEAPLGNSFDEPQSDPNHSTAQNKIDAAPRPSILQKLEDRRRALEAQSIAPEAGSTSVLSSMPVNNKPDDTPGKASAQVENNQKMPHVENSANPIVDDRSSKLDSKSDYDPRQDDTKKWKDLIRRSTQGSSEQRSSGIFRRVKSDSTGERAKMSGDDNYRAAIDRPNQPALQTSDIKVNDFPSPLQNQSELEVIKGDGIKQGWMPPALTTYGEKKFSPAPCLEEKVDPPMKDGYDFSKNTSSQRLAFGVGLPPKVFTPPVSEIEVRPPPEDDSSLGSMGFLFPKQAPPTPILSSVPVEAFAAVPVVPVPSEPKRDPTLVTHKLKPTVGGVDYDYYKTWMLPGAQPPKPKQETNHEIDREDPPGMTTMFKPRRTVVEPIPLTRPLAKATEMDPETGTPGVPTQSLKPPSESWAPSRLTHPITQSEPTDEWEAWREALDAATKAKLPDSLTKRSPTSDISSTSDWAPPTRPVDWNSKNRSIAGGDKRNTGQIWSTWIPPSQASRVDFTGSITSLPTPVTKERTVYKEHVQSTSADATKEISSSSSHTSVSDESSHSSQFSSSRSASESHDVPDDSATSASDSRSGSHSNPGSEPARSVDEVDIGLPVHDAVPAEISSRPGLTEHYDAEKTSPAKPPTIDSKRRFSPFSVCLLVTLSMVVLGGIVAIVVLFLRGKLGDETSSPAVSPTAPSSPSAPVASPGDLTALISASSPNAATALEDPSSAQALALDWLSKNQFLGTYSDEQKIQRFALAVIFYSTTGESWNDKDLWVSDINECDWYSSEVVNEVCNSEHEIDEIDLKMNGLSGEFPWSELVMLSSQLLILDLKENLLSGSIADVVGDMTSLLVFIVENNQFTGTIPSTFGQLTDARQLNLSQNRLSGSIPSEIALMTSLQALSLHDNLLTGTIPSELGQLSNVRSIYLSGNDFVGSMPEEICALSLENLEVNCDVDCSCCTAACGEGSTASPVGGDDGGGNNGTYPNPVGDDLVDEELEGNPIYELIVSQYPGGAEALANAESPQRAAFRWLQSSSNAQISSDEHLLQRYALASLFYATGGSQWKSATSWLSEEDECFWYTTSDAGILCDSNGRLTEMNLESNNLQGTLPMEIGLLADSLEILDLSGNNMTGSIPTTIERMGLLKQIDLSMNKLFGIVPSELGSMSSLQRIVLSDNNLFSTIPTELGLLSQLDYLDIGSNQLTGTIPDSLGSLRSLAGLALYKNFLSGTLPVSLSNLSRLQLLYLDENDLSGPIPSALCQLTLEEFWSDCRETQCNCCTTCCSDGTGCA